jgi:hypothetical protein
MSEANPDDPTILVGFRVRAFPTYERWTTLSTAASR